MNRTLVASLALLLIPLATPPGGAQGMPEWTLDDDTGDQVYLLAEGQNPPAAPPDYLPHTDIDRVTITNEDEVTMQLNVFVAALELGPQRSSGPCFFGSAPTQGIANDLLWVSFAIRDIKFTVRVQLLGDRPAQEGYPFYASGASACLCPGDPPGPGCHPQRVDAGLDDEANAYRLRIHKAGLLGMKSAVSDNPSNPRPGFLTTLAANDTVKDLVVRSEGHRGGVAARHGPVNLAVRDRAPQAETAPPYTFRTGMANLQLRLRLETGSRELPVVAGLNQSIQFVVQNLAETKRLVSLTYGLEGAETSRARYAAHGPATLSIPSGESRAYYLALNVAPEALATENVTLWVRGQSLTHHGEVAFGEALLQPGHPLVPAENVVYLQSKDLPSPTCDAGVPSVQCRFVYLSQIRSDPDADPDGACPIYLSPSFLGPGGGDGGMDASCWLNTRTGFPNPIFFEKGKNVEFELSITSPVEIPGFKIITFLGYLNATTPTYGVNLALGDTEITLPSGTSTQKLSVKRVGPASLERGTKFQVRFTFETPFEPPGIQARALASLKLNARDTLVKVPLIETPEAFRTRLVASPFQLSVEGDRDDFVNPGESHLFNLTILNQGRESHTARFVGRVLATDWSLRFVPGNEFKLQPGDSIRVGALVTAPGDAPEASRAPIDVNVTDPQGHDLGLRLALTVTTQVDLGDEAQDLRVDPDAQEKLIAAPKGKAPGVPFVPAILALCWAWRTSSRRG